MHITKLELDNIKSHASSTFTFERGTTAITGHNGAGKTTIIESIAYVLFDFLDYKKDEFVRHGEQKGSIRLTFVSGLDEREYVIYRDTAAGYYVIDPRLSTKVANKKEEVLRFLWQHLGLEPGTDLPSLYKQAIGVPQGTFTAIFLDGAAERKVAFDRLLKVEEYRQAADKLLGTARYLDGSVVFARESIARLEGELQRSDAVNEEYKGYAEQIESLTADITTLGDQITIKTNLVANLDKLQRITNDIATLKTDQARLLESIAGIDKARGEIADIQPKVVEQEKLEGDIATLRDMIAAGKAVTSQVETLDARILRLRQNYSANHSQLVEAEEKSQGAARVAELGVREDELLRSVANCRAEIDQAAKFKSEIANGLCPILSAKCLNLKEGETLATFVSTRSDNAEETLAKLHTEQARIRAEIGQARDAERFALSLVGLRTRETELKEEGKRLTADKDAFEKQVTDLSVFEERLTEASGNLHELGDPRSRVKVLEAEIAKESGIRSSLATIDADLSILNDKLEGLGDYDATAHANERIVLREIENQKASMSATLDAAKRRQTQLAAEIERFAELQTSLAGEFKEKERLERLAEITGFVRDTLKEAAPRVARNYVHRVSLEANLMFREITGNAEHTLQWADDYSIVLEEDGYKRPFASLSGGEQMVAALSVRLALLKQLTDIRIAFFDEPTTNMDADRRENLAEQIGRITNFDQLFVISHDDTFETSVDNVICVEGRI